MPKLTNSLPKYRKHRSSGQAVVSIAGHDVYLGPHGTKASRAEYDRVIAEYLASGRRHSSDIKKKPATINQLILAYWKHAKGYYVKNGKPTSELAAVKTVLGPVRRLYGKHPPAEFGPLALKAIRETWIRAGHTRGTINKNVRRIVRAFRWAASEEMIPVEIHQALATVEGLKRGRTEARESAPIRPVDVAIVAATLEHLCPIVRDMIRTQLLTGMRPAEVCSIRPGDIDREGDVWEFRPVGHKTEHHERVRTVYIGPEAQAILRPYLLRAEDAYCFSPAEAVKWQQDAKNAKRKTPENYGSRRGYCHGGLAGEKAKRKPGLRYSSDTYRRAIHRACDLAFLPDDELEGDALKVWQSDHRWSPNQLRHTKGTEIRKRFGLEYAQVVLGHSSADVTQIYAEIDAEKAREVARKIG